MGITLGIEATSMSVCSIIVYFFYFQDVALYDPGQGQENKTDPEDYGKVRYLDLHEQQFLTFSCRFESIEKDLLEGSLLGLPYSFLT